MPTNSIYHDPGFCGFAQGALRPGGVRLTALGIGFAKLPPKAKVLDIGCGYGQSMEFLSDHYGYRAWGVDNSTVMIERALAKPPSLKICQASADDLPFVDGFFDCVLAECVFCLFDSKPKALAEIARVLRPGGKLIISDLYCRQGKVPTLYSKAFIQKLLNTAGFEFLVWQDCKTAYKNFVGAAIMDCDCRGDYQQRFYGVNPQILKAGDISYYLGLWQKT